MKGMKGMARERVSKCLEHADEVLNCLLSITDPAEGKWNVCLTCAHFYSVQHVFVLSNPSSETVSIPRVFRVCRYLAGTSRHDAMSNRPLISFHLQVWILASPSMSGGREERGGRARDRVTFTSLCR